MLDNTTVTKIFSFCYGHCLPGHSGKCAMQHGHTGRLEVEVSGVPFQDVVYTDMVVDYNDIKKWVDPIIAKLDHKYLNTIKEPNVGGEDVLVFDDGFPPTTENMLHYIYTLLEDTPLFRGLVRLRLYESDTSYAEWRRPE